MQTDIPLVVPEVNKECVTKDNYIIANPNCSTIQSVVPLKVLHDRFKIKRIVYSTYQAVSGSGIGGLQDLETRSTNCYPYPIEYNCLPHIESFLDNGYTKEEIKMIEETKKILNDQSIKVTATTVRVPVKYDHCVSMNLEFENPFELSTVYELLQSVEGLIVLDDPSTHQSPMPIYAQGRDEGFIGRVRRDFSVDSGLNLWVVADNIRKGAAINTVQIAELLLDYM